MAGSSHYLSPHPETTFSKAGRGRATPSPGVFRPSRLNALKGASRQRPGRLGRLTKKRFPQLETRIAFCGSGNHTAALKLYPGAHGTPSLRTQAGRPGSRAARAPEGRGRGGRGGGRGRPLLPLRAAGLAAPSPLRAAHGAPDGGGGSERWRISGALGWALTHSPSPVFHLPRVHGHHGVQRGGRHQRRRLGAGRGEGGHRQEEAPRLVGHCLAHLLQHRHDRGVRAPRRALSSLCPPPRAAVPRHSALGARAGLRALAAAGGGERAGRAGCGQRGTAGWARRGEGAREAAVGEGRGRRRGCRR